MEWVKYVYQFEGLESMLERVSLKKKKLDQYRPIPSIVVKSIKESLALEWVYNSNAIEGNTLTLQETKMVIEEGFTIKGKSLREHFEAVNHQEAIEYIERIANPEYKLSEHDVLNVHALVLQKIEKDYAGRYRTGGVRIAGANFVPPNALKVPDLMFELVHWVNTDALDLNEVVRSTIFHHRFVWIHPFFDGNGRSARLLFNLLLMKEGYPPAIILKNDRKKYYDALNRSNSGDYSRLLFLILQALERSLDIYLSALDVSLEEYQSIQTIVRDPEVGYGQEYVSLLARRGKIDAYKEGNHWYTTKAAISAYVDNRKRKR